MIVFAFISVSISCVQVIAASLNFPSLSFPRVWDDAIWKDCVTKEVVYPSNCNNSEDSWEECYLVPINGLCVKQNIEPSMYGRLHLELYLFNFTQNWLSYDYNSVPAEGTVQKDRVSVVVTQASPVFEFRIKTFRAKVQRFTVSQECAPNCKECAEGQCKVCEKGWDLFNNACEDPRCQNQLSSISNKILNSAEYYFDSGHYNLQFRFGIPLDDCLTPRIYLTKNILDSSIHYVPSLDRIQLIDKVFLNLKLNTTELEKYCQRFETKQKQISQCSIGVALTYSKMTQYKLIVLGRLVFDKTTQATKEFTQQVEVSSDLGSSAAQISIIGEPASQMLDPFANTVKVVQKITDPIFQNFTLKCLSGILLQGQVSQDMECQKSEESEVMELKFHESIDSSKDFQVIVESELVPPKRRQLQENSQRSGQIKFILKTEDQGEYAEDFVVTILEIWHINAIAIAGLVLLLLMTSKLMVYRLARQMAILAAQEVEVSRIAEELPRSKNQGVQRESSAGIPQSTNTNRHGTQGIILQSIGC